MTQYATKGEFLAAYLPLAAEKASVRRAAKAMGISPSTLQDKKAKWYNQHKTGTEPAQGPTTAELVAPASGRAERIIADADAALREGIADARANGDVRRLCELAIESLKIARTEADVKRVFALVVQDNRQVTINAPLDDVRKRLVEYEKAFEDEYDAVFSDVEPPRNVDEGQQIILKPDKKEGKEADE